MFPARRQDRLHQTIRVGYHFLILFPFVWCLRIFRKFRQPLKPPIRPRYHPLQRYRAVIGRIPVFPCAVDFFFRQIEHIPVVEGEIFRELEVG